MLDDYIVSGIHAHRMSKSSKQLTEKEAKDMLKKFSTAYPEVAKHNEAMQKKLKKH